MGAFGKKEERMRICIFSTTFLPQIGGAEQAMHYIAKYLTELGNQVTVLAPYHKEMKKEIDVNYAIHRYRLFPRMLFLDLTLIIQLMLEKIRTKFDILHAHLAYPPGYCGVRFKDIFNVPVIITLCGADIQKIPEINYGIRLNPQIDMKIRRTLSMADAITVKSHSMRKDVFELGVEEEKVFVVTNGIDLNEFQNGKKFLHNKHYIFAMGRFVYKKGFDLLIKAFSQVAKNTDNVDLLIAGDGPEAKNYQTMIEGLKLDSKIKLVGFKMGEEKVKLLRGCEFFVCPSRIEGLPNVILEAMATGKAIVGTNVDGISDLVENGKNGLLVNPEDIDSLAEGIKRLLNDNSLREGLSKNAREMSREYDWKIISSRYVELYEKVLKNEQKST